MQYKSSYHELAKSGLSRQGQGAEHGAAQTQETRRPAPAQPLARSNRSSDPKKRVLNRAQEDERVQNKYVTKEERRLDSLARVLAPTEGKSMCVACGIVNGQLIIGANKPKIESGITPAQLEDIISARYRIVMDCVNGRLSEDQAVSILSSEQNGRLMRGTAARRVERDRITKDLRKVVAFFKDKLPRERVILISGLPQANALIPTTSNEQFRIIQKVLRNQNALSVLKEKRKGWSSVEQNGREMKDLERRIKELEAKNSESLAIFFLKQQLDEIKQEIKIIVEIEEHEKEIADYGKMQKLLARPDYIELHVHAEQLVAVYTLKNKKDGEKLPYLGISKLCCDACDNALTEAGFDHRGSHKGTYPNYSLLQQKFLPLDQEEKGTDWQQPSDSESGDEFLRFRVPTHSAITAPAAAVPPRLQRRDDAVMTDRVHEQPSAESSRKDTCKERARGEEQSAKRMAKEDEQNRPISLRI